MEKIIKKYWWQVGSTTPSRQDFSIFNCKTTPFIYNTMLGGCCISDQKTVVISPRPKRSRKDFNEQPNFLKSSEAFSPKYYRLFGLVLICLVLLPSLLFAQPSGFAGAFSRIGFGPRGMAMSNAMSGAVDEGVYSYYNPSIAAATTGKRQFDVSSSLMSFDRNLHKLNGTFSLPPNAGITFSIINGSLSGIDGRTSSGYHTETLSTNEFQFATAFGVRFTPKLYAGVGIKYFLADYHTDLQNTTTFGFDVGALFRASDKLILGVTIQDLLAKYTWDTGRFYGEDSSARTSDRFPVTVRFGSSYKLNDSMLLVLEPGMMLLPTTDSETVYQIRAGGRYRIHEYLSLRGGWQVSDLQSFTTSHNFSAGFSIHLPFDLFSPSVDYAFVPEPNQISSMHVFGLKLNL